MMANHQVSTPCCTGTSRWVYPAQSAHRAAWVPDDAAPCSWRAPQLTYRPVSLHPTFVGMGVNALLEVHLQKVLLIV